MMRRLSRTALLLALAAYGVGRGIGDAIAWRMARPR